MMTASGQPAWPSMPVLRREQRTFMAPFLLGAGTDATRASSYNLWLSLVWLVSGQTIGGLALSPAQNGVHRATALQMYTAAGAEPTGEAAVKGTITAGKYADLAVLSADYFTVAGQDISRVESMFTVAGGTIVSAAGEYEGLAAPLPAPAPKSSPVARSGGFQSSGVRQAHTVSDAARDSAPGGKAAGS
jgi:Amidohydrolase family